MSDRITDRKVATRNECIIDLSLVVDCANPITIAPQIASRIIRQIVDPLNARTAVHMAKVVVLPLDASVHNSHEHTFARHLKLSDRTIDPDFRSHPVKSVSSRYGGQDCYEGRGDCATVMDVSISGCWNTSLCQEATRVDMSFFCSNRLLEAVTLSYNYKLYLRRQRRTECEEFVQLLQQGAVFRCNRASVTEDPQWTT